MNWEIYALRYAHHARMSRDNFITAADPHERPMPLDYFVWLLRSGDRQIVVDTGFSAEVAEQRGRKLLIPVGEALAKMGADPAAVQDVILTHLHYDHAGNLPLFPNAKLHVQDREMAFATGRHVCSPCIRQAFEVEDVLAMIRALYAGRVEFHDGEGEVAPGVTLHRVGGHTDGLQAVRVQTERGPVCIAGDASHFYANMERQIPFPIVFNVGDMVQGWRSVLRLAGGVPDRVIPGHDPEVTRIFPALPGSDGQVLCLHQPPIAR